jgi:hypothetical protein
VLTWIRVGTDNDLQVDHVVGDTVAALGAGAGPDRVGHALRAVAASDVVLDHTLVQGITELVQVRRASSARPFPQVTDGSSTSSCSSPKASTTRRSLGIWCSARRRSATTFSNVFAEIQTPDRPGAIGLAHRHRLGT